MKNTKKLLYTLLMIVAVITMSMNAHAAIKLNKTKATLARTSDKKKPTLQLTATVLPENTTSVVLSPIPDEVYT